MNKTRLKNVLIWIAAMVAFALLAGWSVHRDSPGGMLAYTAGQACPTISHGFSKLYGLMLGVAAGVALAVAAASYILAELRLMSSGREAMRAFSLSCLVFALGMGVMSLLMAPIEHLFPLTPAAACPAPPPTR
jgi:hypothetical protein